MTVPITKEKYLPHVDALRAIAVLAVVVYHLDSSWLPGGFSGVDIFFVISGFIVSASVGSLKPTNLLSFMAYFYARRLQRIAPALVTCLLVTGVATSLFIPAAWLSEGNQRTATAAFFGFSNFVLARTNNDYFSPLTDFNPYAHTWSLGVEEQFYFLFPLLFFIWSLEGKWRNRAMGLFAIALAASFGNAVWLSQTNATYGFYMITSRLWELAAGVLLYQLTSLYGRRFHGADRPPSRGNIIFCCASLALIAYGFAASAPGTFPYPGAIPSVLGALGLIGFMHGLRRDHVLMKVLANRPMLFIGKISYSLYLWHWPVFVLFRWTVGLDSLPYQMTALVLAFVLATASYYWVETPFRNSITLRNRPRHVVIAIGVLSLSVCVGLAHWIDRARPIISASVVAQHPGDWYPDRANPNEVPSSCSVGISNSTVGNDLLLTYSRQKCARPTTAPRLFVAGDSHALAYEGMYKSYVMQTGASVMIFNNGGCPFIGLQPWREDNPACVASGKTTIDALLSRLRPGDILFLPSLRLPRFVDQWFRLPEIDRRNVLNLEWAREERKQSKVAAAKTLRQLRATGARIVLEAPKPIFRSPLFRCAASYNRSNDICRDGNAIDRVELLRMRKPITDAFDEFALSIPGVSVWDPFPVLCPPALLCNAFMNGRPLFFDGDHLSGFGNQLLLSSFKAFVASAK